MSPGIRSVYTALTSLLLFDLSFAGAILAQQKPAQAVVTTSQIAPAKSTAAVKNKKKLTPEEQIGFDLLESSLAASRKLDVVSQGHAAWEASRIYLRRSADRDVAEKLLEEGFYRVLNARDEQEKRLVQVRTEVEARLLKALVTLDVKKAEELLPQAEDYARKDVESALVSYYIGHGNDGRALELVRQMAIEHEMSYGDAMTLMSHLKPGQESLRRDIFVESMGSFTAHEHNDSLLPGRRDFPVMITTFAPLLPSPLVAQAVEEVLSQAKRADAAMASKNGYLQAHVVTDNGEATWSSFYDFELFALLPALRDADPIAAEARIKDSPTARVLLAKYENGLGDLSPSTDDPAGQSKNSNLSIGISMGDGNRRAEPPDPDQRIKIEISHDIDEHPEGALAKIPQMKSGWLRAASYVEIGRKHWKNHPATAHEALRKALDEAGTCIPEEAGGVYTDVANIYVLMGEEEGAKKALERGTVAATKLYEKDTNPDRPNLAPEMFWPSSALWVRMIRAGAKISPRWAVELLKSAPGEDVVSIGQMVIAAKLLDVDYLAPSMMEIHPGSSRIYQGEEDGKVEGSLRPRSSSTTY